LGKKEEIVKTAIKLFADQGFDATTTLQISRETGITEPLVFYYFKNKEDLFSHILESTFHEYLLRLKKLESSTESEFQKIENLISLHFKIAEEMPEETYILISTCPSKLRDEAHVCAKNVENQRKLLIHFLEKSLKAGMASGEFNQVPVQETANLLIAMINGLLRQRGLHLEAMEGMRDTTVAFCRRSLVSA